MAEHQFVAANGIAISPDEKTLFVASFGAGITAINLVSQIAEPLRHPSNLSLAYIDGLYAFRGNLIAVQNGPMAPRIVRLVLGPDHSSITRINVLERKNPLFDGVTTGVVSGDRLYYIANPQLDKTEDGKLRPNVKLNTLTVLALPLGSSDK